jgi:hypothetical protein
VQLERGSVVGRDPRHDFTWTSRARALTSLRSGPRLSSLTMETLRKRIPFTHKGDDDLPEDENRVLDEQGASAVYRRSARSNQGTSR